MSEFFREGDVVKFKEPVRFLDLSRGTHYTVTKDEYGNLHILDDVGDKRYVFTENDEYVELVSTPADNASVKQKLTQIEALLAEVKLALG